MKVVVHREKTTNLSPFILQHVKDYLRVTHNDEDLAIQQMAEAAALEIENLAQIALLTQNIRVTVFDPRSGESYLSLPIGPCPANAAASVLIDGEPFSGFELLTGSRPSIRWLSSFHELRPARIAIQYQAGFGATADSIPADLAQAIKDQTCLQYDGRSPDDDQRTSSHQVFRVSARHRGVAI